MTDYREILSLKSQGFSERNIALRCCCSRNTVSSVLKRANELDITWPLKGLQSNAIIQAMLLFKERPQIEKDHPDSQGTRIYPQLGDRNFPALVIY